ncbi:CsbD family protein [Methylobacterium sp. J-030]|uniref:CsbD family protein n=1 Tax=Methylobacterium sp. J-030 TaxID=2836627 RepID=UPI001FB9EAA7|nr:CsbD family protein [Methylobacterium sp. J-030]MCJ2072973.1 CsbD family protein [Methylobacterium sp. J-030]
MVDTNRITGAAREFGGKVQGAIGDAAGSHRASIEGRLNEAQGTAENLFGQAKDAVHHAVDTVAHQAEDAYDQGRHYAWKGHQKSVEWPHASLVVAGLVGLGLGLLISKL